MTRLVVAVISAGEQCTALVGKSTMHLREEMGIQGRTGLQSVHATCLRPTPSFPHVGFSLDDPTSPT